MKVQFPQKVRLFFSQRDGQLWETLSQTEPLQPGDIRDYDIVLETWASAEEVKTIRGQKYIFNCDTAKVELGDEYKADPNKALVKKILDNLDKEAIPIG